jgi:signal transduction histidine kinase
VANFSVAARTLIHLGAELITSDEIALNELIKNAFDADSKRVHIDFRIGLPQNELDRLLEQARAHTTESTGLADFVDEVAKKLSDEGAKPHGDATRGAQLVDALKATTSWPETAAVLEMVNTITISDRGSGMDKLTLETVFLQIGTPSRYETQTSTELHRTILGNKGIGRLAMMRLGDRTTVTSWAAPESAHQIAFDWRAFDKVDTTLDLIPVEIAPTSQAHDGPSGTVIEIGALCSVWDKKQVEDRFVGAFLRRLQNPFQDMTKQALFPIDVHYNGGDRIPIEGMKKVLSEHAQADLELVFAPDVDEPTDTVVTTTLVDHLRGIDPQQMLRTRDEVAHKVEATPEELRSIGPFTARLRWFNRDTLRTQTTLHGTTKEAKAELDLWSGGVAIYRDGFRVGFSGQSSGEDWLAIDSSALKRGGFAVNRIQTVGAIEISRVANPNLIDRSNREGLIDSRQTKIVRSILFDFAIEELRRHISHEGEEEKRGQLEEVAKSAPETIRSRIKQAEQGLAEIRARVPADTKKTVQSITDHLHFIKAETKRFEEAARQVGERREDILELAGVGTVMSGVLHELTRTTGHTRQLLQKLAKDESPETRALLVKLDNEIKAINTRLRQLDPLTPSGRHRKEQFDLSALLQTILHGYEARFDRHEVHAFLKMSGQAEVTPFMVTMVRGFVSLAVENLITNSVYWLQRGLKAGQTQREIYLELDPESKTLTVWDNGPGIASADKGRVFTAGFTLRPRGQGLGLFLAAEIATYHQAQLVLDGADDDGRYRAFVLQLPKE